MGGGGGGCGVSFLISPHSSRVVRPYEGDYLPYAIAIYHAHVVNHTARQIQGTVLNWSVGFSHETSDANISLKESDRQNMGCAPMGSGVG